MIEPRRARGGPTKDARRGVYQDLADRIGGRLIEGRMAGGIGVVAEHDGRALTLSLHPVQTGTVTLLHTRVLALFQAREEIRLVVRPRRFVDRLVARLGFGGLQVAGRSFAERFVVRGRPESRVRSVMSAGIAASIEGERDMRIEVGRASRRDRREAGLETRRLEVLVPRMETDVDRMVRMFDVAREGVDALVRIGAASAHRAG